MKPHNLTFCLECNQETPHHMDPERGLVCDKCDFVLITTKQKRPKSTLPPEQPASQEAAASCFAAMREACK